MRSIIFNKNKIDEYNKKIDNLYEESENIYYTLLNELCKEFNLHCKIEYSSIVYESTLNNIIIDNPVFIRKHSRKRTQTIINDNLDYCFTLYGMVNQEEINRIQETTYTILKDTVNYNGIYNDYFFESK